MKKLLSLLFVLLLIVPFAVACTNEDTDCEETEETVIPAGPYDGKNVVQEMGFKELLASWICDPTTEEAIYEFSQQILKVKILERTDVMFAETGLLCFTYKAEVEKVYMDVTDTLKEGDVITLYASQGFLTAEEAGEVIPDGKFITFDESLYEEGDYVCSSIFDGIPIEAGVSYVMHTVYNDYWEGYSDMSYSHIFGIYGDDIYQGKDAQKCGFTLAELEEQIMEGIENRSGRLEEIGESALMKELGQKQFEELQKQLEANEIVGW